MQGKEVYKIWAPYQARWTAWTRAVAFTEIDGFDADGYAQLDVPDHLEYVDMLEKNCAFFIDLPDYYAMEDALVLARLGWRPIPLYNGTDAQHGVMALCDNRDVTAALMRGSVLLKKIDIPLDAPPAFLLDTTRVQRYKMSVSVFDNSWDLYPQDVPSSAYLLNNGINKIVLRADKIEKDLKKIFFRYSQAGIEIYYTNGFDTPKAVKIRKPRGE